MPSSTDSDLSFDKSLNKQKMSATRLFGKENCKLISKLGLPLLSEGSLIVNNNSKYLSFYTLKCVFGDIVSPCALSPCSLIISKAF